MVTARALSINQVLQSRTETSGFVPIPIRDIGELGRRVWWYALVMGFGFIGYATKPEGDVAFFAMTALLTLFVASEILNRVRKNKSQWLLEPAVWASMFTFGLVYGITNFMYFLPEDQLAISGLTPVITPEMNKVLAMALIAAPSMWWGFYLGVGEGLGRRLRGLFGPVIRKQLNISLFWLAVFVAVSVLARYQQISLGVFGYTSEYQALLEYGAVREYLDIGAGLGMISLLVASLAYFQTRRREWLAIVLALVICELTFAFLGGFKSRVLLPVVVVGGAFLVTHGSIPRWFVPSMLAAVVIAYAVIEPFRQLTHSGAGIESTRVGSIARAVNEAASGALARDHLNTELPMVPILARTNITYLASLGIVYADEAGELPPGTPSFLADIFLAPLHAVVPRLIWDTKPAQSLGLWYVQEVMGIELITSAGMGPITYLYFAGGITAVILGFAAVGIIQRAILTGFFTAGWGGVICYLLLLPTLVMIDSAFNTLFVAIVRYTFIYLGMQWLLLRR